MKTRLALSFPYLCAAVVAGLIGFDRLIAPADGAGMAASCHDGGIGAAGTATPMAGLPPSLYYASVGVILVLSFALIERGARRPPRASKRPRIDLLGFSPIGRLVVHPATRFVAQLLVVTLFVLIIAAGLFGNQLPTKNIAPLLTWTAWWCGLIAVILYAGKAWCYVCPWDAISGWAEGLKLWKPARRHLGLGLPWPKAMRNIWPATLFFLLLTWIELGLGVTMHPRATAYLGLTMLAMAFVSAFVFDRKSFCRYGCLVGRISGLYALFSPVEVRARDREVCRSCDTKSCFKGNDRGEPCPTFQFPAVMDQNTYCISCMECVKTCESQNVAVNMRPWGEDLLHVRKPRSDEAYLALLMLSLTGFHGLTMTGTWGRIIDAIRRTLGLGETAAFTLGMVAITLAPIALYAGLVSLSRWSGRDRVSPYKKHFVRYAYALLPIALFYHLAHNSEHMLLEGPKLIALASDPLGWQWDIFGTAAWNPGPYLRKQTLWIIQILLVLVGHIYSLRASRQAATELYSDSATATRSQIPMLVAMIMFSIMSLWLLKQPMAMRTTWM